MTSSLPPLITIPHEATRDDEGGEITIYNFTPEPFLACSDYLYPELLSGSLERKGQMFSGFVNGEFVGSVNVTTVGNSWNIAAMRKNPWFEDREEWFLRFFLASCKRMETTLHHSICNKHNVGTLRFYEKLGLGGKSIQGGRRVRSCGRTDQTAADLSRMIAEARTRYTEIRRAAEHRMKNVKHSEIITPEALFSEAGITAVRYTVDFIKS